MENSQSHSLTWNSLSTKEYGDHELLRLIFKELSEIKEMLESQSTNESMRTKLQLHKRAIKMRNVEISKLRAEVDLLTQAVRRNEHVVDWLDNVAYPADADLTKRSGKKSLFARIRSVFS
uniref:Uncharacterized protein n=1 Tax=Panagrolaimus sp. JU765 TaxID=591449 RepID=A0AC34RIU8_9BILA